MASGRGTIRGAIGDGKVTTAPSRIPAVEEIVPSHSWTEDLNGHYLLVDLPDFKKEQVKIQVIDSGIIKVNGERPINENKRVKFEQTFKIPENTAIDIISAKFDCEAQILYVTIPKRKVEENKEREPEPHPSNLINAQKEENVNKEPDESKDINNKDKDSHEGNQESSAKTGLSEEVTDARRSQGCEPSDYFGLRSAVEILAKNKKIVVTAMLAFSLGMFMSRKFESNEE